MQSYPQYFHKPSYLVGFIYDLLNFENFGPGLRSAIEVLEPEAAVLLHTLSKTSSPCPIVRDSSALFGRSSA